VLQCAASIHKSTLLAPNVFVNLSKCCRSRQSACGALRCVAVYCSVLYLYTNPHCWFQSHQSQCVAVCCSVLQCIAVYCSVLQCNVVNVSVDLSRDYGMACISRLLKIIGLFCKRALLKRQCSAKETYNFLLVPNVFVTLPKCCRSRQSACGASRDDCSVLQCVADDGINDCEIIHRVSRCVV